MADKVEEYATKAAEAFVAAGRAETSIERSEHRARAEHYVRLLKGLRGEATPGTPP